MNSKERFKKLIQEAVLGDNQINNIALSIEESIENELAIYNLNEVDYMKTVDRITDYLQALKKNIVHQN